MYIPKTKSRLEYPNLLLPRQIPEESAEQTIEDCLRLFHSLRVEGLCEEYTRVVF